MAIPLFMCYHSRTAKFKELLPPSPGQKIKLYDLILVINYDYGIFVIMTTHMFREKLNSMNLLLYMAPIAVLFLLPATLWMEDNVVGITLALTRDDIKIVWNLIFNSALAYFVNLTNFLVTKHTSALTLQLCK